MRASRLIVDYGNVLGELDANSQSKCSVKGFQSLLELFDFKLCELLVVGPVMPLQHSGNAGYAYRIVDSTRQNIHRWASEAKELDIRMPLAPPGGVWHGEVGVDAIIALIGLHYASVDNDLETIILSSDADLQGLRTHNKEILPPLVVGFFDSDDRRQMRRKNSQRFISADGLHEVLIGLAPKWTPKLTDGEWHRGEVRMSELRPDVVATKSLEAKTSCVVDPYGLVQVGIRQLGIGHEPNTNSVSTLLTRLGFPGPISQRWTVPNIRVDEGVDPQVGVLWKQKDEVYDSLSQDIRDDLDDLTQVRRATQRVSGTFADRFVFEFGKERLLNHRWMKQLTTGLISDLWAAIHDAKMAPGGEVVVITGNLDMEHCLRVCSAYGPEELQKDLRRVFLVFGEPPGLQEEIGRKGVPFTTWASENSARSSSPRGLLRFITLTDRQLAQLLGVSDSLYGRHLRAHISGQPWGLEGGEFQLVDPDTAIEKIPGDAEADPPQNVDRYVPSGNAAATSVRVNGTNVELIGFRSALVDRRATANFETWYSKHDDALSPILLQAGGDAVGRSRAMGISVAAEVIRRAGRFLNVRLLHRRRLYDSAWINIDDMPHRFAPGDVVTIEALEADGEKWVLIDVPKLRDVPDPEPVKVRIVSVDGRNPLLFRVSAEGDNGVSGEMRLRPTPFAVAQPEVGDQILALEVFAEEGKTTEGISRQFLGLSSTLPRQSGDEINSPMSQEVKHAARVATDYFELKLL